MLERNAGFMRAHAFSLLEVVIVVIIIGVIAAIAIPRVSSAVDRAGVNAFINDLNTFATAAERYKADHGKYPEDAGSGQLPSGFDEYIRPQAWLNGTSIGGMWDTESNDVGGYSFALGVHFQPVATQAKSNEFMKEIDVEIDDGDLITGQFRRIAARRFYLILEP
ncbi:MAG: prepilin-type N-terminal cleavage/methylation domain-containing protein [Rhodospirillales bacterium]|nr:prepilin-type N-terminal cleavage/methylation domain-containing protein [Rhodospirillales bacterium]